MIYAICRRRWCALASGCRGEEAEEGSVDVVFWPVGAASLLEDSKEF